MLIADTRVGYPGHQNHQITKNKYISIADDERVEHTALG